MQPLYGQHARFYDAIYRFKDYAAEAQRVRSILAGLGVEERGRLLDVGCGTASHLVELAKWYEVAGFDLSPSMIDFAKAKLPTADLFVADMTDFEVKDPVDAVVCLFGGIGYVFPKERLNSTARAFADAVKPGGALIVEPWLTEELFVEGRITMQTYDTEGLKICRSVVAKKDGAFSTFRFHWLAAEAGAEDVEYFIDDHRLWLCPHETLLGAFDRAGFDVRFDPDGLMPDRGLVVGTRRG